MPNASPLPVQFSSINFFKMSSSQQPPTLILRDSFRHQLFGSLSAVCNLYPIRSSLYFSYYAAFM